MCALRKTKMTPAGIPHKARRRYRRLSREEILNIQTLAKVGLSLRKISMQLNVPKTTVYYHVKEQCDKMTYMDIGAISEKELGYLVGVFVGDGCFIVNPKHGAYITKFTLDATRDKDISRFLRNILEKAGKRVGWRIERGSIVLRVHSKKLVEFISGHIMYIKQSDSPRNIKVLINSGKWTMPFKLGFIGGLIDSDGHVYYNKKRTRQFGALVKTVNKTLRDDVVRILSSLGIQVTTYVAGLYEGSYSRNLRYVMYIPSAELKKTLHKISAVKLKRYGRQ